jgi:hypothetical protein
MCAARILTVAGGVALAAVALGGCGKMKQNDPDAVAKARAEAKRQQSACASPAAYERLKGLLFDQAIGRHAGDRANLDTLADYSVARMDEPVVKGWDPALDVIRCKGRFILEVPPGAERGLAGARRLEADIDYTAQAAADGSGFVYALKGAEPIVVRLAAFDLTSGAYRPPPAIDEGQTGPEAPRPTLMARADLPPPPPSAATARPAPVAEPRPAQPAGKQPAVHAHAPQTAAAEPGKPASGSSAGGTGEATVRAFYGALGAGNGATASAHIVPEKRSSRAFSPEAISRFYGRLPEPIRLTGIAPAGRGAWRVTYRYSAGRSHCNGSAVVTLTNRGGHDLIRSVRALSGC